MQTTCRAEWLQIEEHNINYLAQGSNVADAPTAAVTHRCTHRGLMQQAGMGQSHRNEVVKWPRCTHTHTHTRIQSHAQLERQSQSPSLQYILAVYRRIIISRLLTPSISLSPFLCIRGSRWRCAATRRGGT